MSLVTASKDYFDFINNVAQNFLISKDLPSGGIENQWLGNLPLWDLFRINLSFAFDFLKTSIHYIFTFGWLHDFVNLPVVIPRIYNSILSENWVFNSNSITVSFLKQPAFNDNKFLIGFFNSFFLALPFSVSQIISFRRLVIQGELAGISSICGTVFAQWIFLICIICGFRWPLIPLLNLEPFLGILSVLTVFHIVFRMWRKINVRYTVTNLYLYGALNFFLAWTEQTTIFQYLNTLSLDPSPSIVETWFTYDWTKNFYYLFGITLGLLVFTFLVWRGIYGLYFYVQSKFFPKTDILFTIKVNRFLIPFILTLNIMIIPYYGIDNWLSNPLGFVPQDRTFWYKKYIPGEGYRFWRTRPRFPIQQIRRDEARKDRGQYLSRFNNLDRKKPVRSFEKLNYSGENAWHRRRWKRNQLKRRFKRIAGLRSAFAKLITGKERRERTNLQGRADIADLIKYRTNAVRKQVKKELASKLKYQKTTLPNLESKQNQLDNYSQEQIAQLLTNSTNSQNLAETRANQAKEQIGEKATTLQEQAGTFGEEEDPYSRLARKNDNAGRKTKFDLLNWHSFSSRAFRHNPRNKPSFSVNQVSSAGPRQDQVRRVLNRERKFFYYYHPVTQVLLNAKIDTILARQPKTYALKNDHEKSLFQRRVILSRYYDSLLDYSKLASYFSFTNTTGGARSFAHRAYKHQFKGTLRVVRRLFRINYTNKNQLNSFNDANQGGGAAQPSGLDQNKSLTSARVLQFDQPLYTRKLHKENPLLHEELEQYLAPSSGNLATKVETSDIADTPLLTKTNPVPFYAGWDEERRQFSITNIYLPRSLSSKALLEPKPKESRRTKANRKIKLKRKTATQVPRNIIQFQLWPIANEEPDPKAKFNIRPQYISVLHGENFKMDTRPTSVLTHWMRGVVPPPNPSGKKLVVINKAKRKFNYSQVPTTVLKAGEKEPSFKGLAPGGSNWPGSTRPRINPLLFRAEKVYNQIAQTLQQQIQKIQRGRN